jgi:hypothetical protein
MVPPVRETFVIDQFAVLSISVKKVINGIWFFLFEIIAYDFEINKVVKLINDTIQYLCYKVLLYICWKIVFCRLVFLILGSGTLILLKAITNLEEYTIF